MKYPDSITVFKINQHEIGMFAQLNYCLLLAKYCSEKNLTPYFFLTGKEIHDDPLFFGMFSRQYNIHFPNRFGLEKKDGSDNLWFR